MKLRGYQREIVDQLKSTSENRLVESATGSGKTFTFCSYLKEILDEGYEGRIIIGVHRDELLQQTCETLIMLGIYPGEISAKVKRAPNQQIIVGMQKTIENRFKNNPNYIQDVSMMILDEAHYLSYTNLLPIFPDTRLIGVTATPISMKKGFKLSDIFLEMISGPPIKQLIEDGSLVQDVCYHLPLTAEDFSKLKKSTGNGGFTSASLNKVFNQGLLLDQLLEYYRKYSDGLKTMIYAASTKNMEEIKDFLLKEGLNVRSYGSNSSESRKELMEWLRFNDDAILVSLEVFTTGLDVKDIRTIILFRATTSKSLYLQMVGRGARSTTEVYKDHFVFIDFGGNIARFGLWSMDRDWESDFRGIKKSSKAGTSPVRECPKCGRINHASARTCDECDYTFPIKVDEFVVPENIKVVRVSGFQAPPIVSKKVWNYCQLKGFSPHKSIHLLLDGHIRILKIYDINKDRFERDGIEILAKIWKEFRPKYREMAGLSDGIIKQGPHNVKYWKNEMVKKVVEYYGESLLVKDWKRIGE